MNYATGFRDEGLSPAFQAFTVRRGDKDKEKNPDSFHKMRLVMGGESEAPGPGESVGPGKVGF